MSYRIDVMEREGRAFIERMFNSRNGLSLKHFAVYGVAISGTKAQERTKAQNDLWLYIVDTWVLSKALQVRANYGAWTDGGYEASFLALMDRVDGLAFEGIYAHENLHTFKEAGEEAILKVTCDDATETYSAGLYYPGLLEEPCLMPIKTWRGGE